MVPLLIDVLCKWMTKSLKVKLHFGNNVNVNGVQFVIYLFDTTV